MRTNEYTFEVKWGETDAAGIVYYPNFYKWMNDATQYFFKKVGYHINDLMKEEGNIGIPLLEAQCQFKKILLFDDRVTVRSTMREIRNKVFIIDHVFMRDDTLIAEGYEIRAWTAFEPTPRAVPIPDHVRAAFS